MEKSPTRAHKLVRFGALLCAGVLLFMLIAWVASDPQEHLRTDWTAFDNAGDRVIGQETVYRPWNAETEPLPYLYPPFGLVLSLPLAVFGFWGSFILSSFGPLVAYIVGLRFFGRLGVSRQDRTTGIVLALASGVAIGSTLIGQYSGLYVLFLGAGAYLFQRDRRLLAGLVLSLLWLKPNIAIAVPVLLVWSRSWKTLRGFGAGSVGLVALSLPFGLHQWGDFLNSAQRMAELQEQGVVPINKMVTALSAVQTVFGLEAEVGVSLGIWLTLTAVLGVAVLAPWTKGRLESDPLRAFGALCLFVVAANPRLYFYDATVAALGMYGVWLSARASERAFVVRWTAVAGLALWVGLWGNIWSELNVLVGPVVGVTLVFVGVDSVRSDSAKKDMEFTANHSLRVFQEIPHDGTPLSEAA